MFKRFAVATDIKTVHPTASGSKKISLYSGTGRQVVAENGAPVSFDYDPENFVYFRCRAITADTPNGNGDLFPESELKKSYRSFIGVGLYKDHDSDSVDKSIGKVLWAEWVPEGKYVECYCCVDRKLSPDMARRVEMGEASTVSMGCMVGEAMCSVCSNVAHNQMELCEHMIPGRGVKGKKHSGEVAYEVNKFLQFTELSLVTVPADPTARIFEVFAGLQKGTVSVEDFRRALREEIQAAMSGAISSGTTTNGLNTIVTFVPASATSTIGNVTYLGPSATTGFVSSTTTEGFRKEEPVAKLVDTTEEKMKLNISYQRGSNLANSFFVAKQDGAEFKAAIAEVMPLRVQEAIQAREPGVATPEQVIADLSTKCDSLASFKAWAKKRRKKNKRAMEKMQKDMEGKGDAADEAKKEASPVAEAIPASTPAVAEAPAGSGTSVMDPAGVTADPALDMGDQDHSHTEPATGNPAQDVSVEEIQMAIQELQKRLDERMSNSSASAAPQKKATVMQKDIKEHREEGEVSKDSHSKYAPEMAAGNKDATQEVASTNSDVEDHRDQGEMSNGKYAPENPVKMPGGMKSQESKDHRDDGKAGAGKYAPAKVSAEKKPAMAKTAEEATWSWNSKELEEKPKASKPAQAAPPLVTWDSKEMASEQIKHEPGAHASKVKQYFGRLPAKGPSAAPKALDLKSGVDPEKEALRRENAALKEKENLQQIADKIYEVVKALREKNMLTAEREDEVIGILGSSFKDLASLDSVLGLVEKLSAAAEAAKEPEAVAEGVEVGSVVPQVFEPISKTEDAIGTMARIWNL